MSYSKPAKRDLSFTIAARAWTDGVTQALAAAWRLWRQRGSERRHLAELDIRSLRELGIAPELADYELRQPFWRPMRDRRH